MHIHFNIPLKQGTIVPVGLLLTSLALLGGGVMWEGAGFKGRIETKRVGILQLMPKTRCS